jgi:orotidine-5'-phosphate decarboxylase
MQNISDKLIVALDVDTLEEAKRLVDTLYPTVKLFKIGSRLFTALGPEAIKTVGEKGAKVFLDLKFNDIPQTVFSGVVSGTGLSCEPVFISTTPSSIGQKINNAMLYPVFMMTVHTGGVDRKMLEEAVRGAKEKASELNIDPPLIVGVTVLTSDTNSQDTLPTVIERAKFAKDAGLNGVVCSVSEAREVRSECGKDFIIVTPGIRPKGAASNDQKRIATPTEAMKAGADFIVVGRPILEAEDPRKAAEAILKELS